MKSIKNEVHVKKNVLRLQYIDDITDKVTTVQTV